MEDTQQPWSGTPATEISKRIVRLVREYVGRGPTSARTYINDDLVSVVLRDTLTKGEQSLIRDGRQQEVMNMRRAFQETMREPLVHAVEEVLGREVIAFLSANHADPDLAVETFVLAPRPDSGPVAQGEPGFARGALKALEHHPADAGG